ncbi:hypothetical protein BVER_02528c [Candidatus Burkholderia verschuerenii]|uniref:Uncharacterized protein n=1 Tax=Candidatus Burkholderia verschuerenii TaxID=242163 RepID=A0A0L0MC79_9BURK|nr:hypothetical protein [Candidatus Burkholderia verschuerenii]KND60317.1 hypothetical protein BVER_02528c [Candidatus Burkholderia verschuerenii]
MRGHINDSTKKTACACFALALCLSVAQTAFAKPGGEPLILDTETGIHSGVPGTVLQTASLNSSGMVQMDTLPILQQQEQQPIVVSPYVEYPTGQNSTSSSGYSGGRRRAPQTPYLPLSRVSIRAMFELE